MGVFFFITSPIIIQVEKIKADENYGGTLIYGENLPILHVKDTQFSYNKDTGDFDYFLRPSFSNLISFWNWYNDFDHDDVPDLGYKCTTSSIKFQNSQNIEIVNS